jgi:hypothetical protein
MFVRLPVKRSLCCLAILLPALSRGVLANVPDPYQIYARARDVWSSARYPSYVSYTIAVTVDDKGVQKTEHYQALFDASRDKVFVNPVSEEEQADPHTPSGINEWLEPKRKFQTLFKRPVGRPEAAIDFLGVPMLAANYSFGIAPYVPQIASTQADQAALVEEIRREYNDPMSAQKQADLQAGEGLKQIANVVSEQRDYRIVYDGIENVNGSACYHLSLQPIHASNLLRLRALWIDTQTYATIRLVTQGNFSDDAIPWTVTFTTIGGVPYIASETAQKPVSDGRYTYEQATISFQSVGATQAPEHPWDLVTPAADVLEEPAQNP